MKFNFSVLAIFLAIFVHAQRVKIPIDTARWYQLNHTASTLAKVFDGNKDSKANTGWSKILYNYDAYYPLLDGEQMTIDSVRIYDKEGVFTTTPLLLYGVTSTWERKLIATFTGESYNVWIGPYPSRAKVFKLDSSFSDIRYLQLNINDNCFPGEIELYGTYTPPAPRTTPWPTRPDVPLKNQFGINGFPWTLIDPYCTWCVQQEKYNAITSFRGFRHYLDWRKMEEKQGQYTFSPMMGGGWHLDTVYKRLQEAGIEPLATFQGIPDWIMATYPDSLRAYDNNPLRYGADFADPASYIEQAKLGFQFAARYGRNKNIDSNLVSVYGIPQWTFQRVNQKKIGLGTVKYIECGNEQNKWWRGRKGYQSGREYAANLSAFYDGHKGALGPGVGVKAADSTMVVVMNGIASITTDYISGMIDWCKEFRGYKPDGSVNLCFEVINYHLYSNDAGNSQSGTSTRGAAPEKSNSLQVAGDFLKFTKEQLNGMPVWVTEQGFDESSGSPLKAIPIGNKTALQTQADWSLRTGLLYARAGIERGFFFETFDATPGSPWKFATMGLIDKSNYSRKPAADFLYQTNQKFGEYVYKQTVSNDPFVDRYEYNGESMYALTIPDEVGRTALYSLSLTGADSATIYTPTIGSDTMVWQRVPVVAGELALTVTETPVFVVPQYNAVSRAAPRTVAVGEAELKEEKTGISLYPNPATDNVRIQNMRGGKWKIVLMDLKSNKLQEVQASGQSATLSLQRLPAGVYPVYVLDENGKTVFSKFVVKQ